MRFRFVSDRGTIATRDLATKCRTYTHYVASREWLRERGNLPFLLIITPERDQEMRIARIATVVLAYTRGLKVSTTTMTWLIEQGSPAPIWHQVLPQSGGTDIIPCCKLYCSYWSGFCSSVFMQGEPENKCSFCDGRTNINIVQ